MGVKSSLLVMEKVRIISSVEMGTLQWYKARTEICEIVDVLESRLEVAEKRLLEQFELIESAYELAEKRMERKSDEWADSAALYDIREILSKGLPEGW